jgi:hypothetical protein
MSVAELRRLLWHLVLRWVPDHAFVLAWSYWRRRHQAIALRCHYRRRRIYLIGHLQL